MPTLSLVPSIILCRKNREDRHREYRKTANIGHFFDRSSQFLSRNSVMMTDIRDCKESRDFFGSGSFFFFVISTNNENIHAIHIPLQTKRQF